MIVIAAFLTQRALRVTPVRLRWHQRILTLPVLGVLSRSINTARFSSTLAILVGSGVPMLRSLQAAGETITNLAMRTRVMDAVQRVREGFSLAKALRALRHDKSSHLHSLKTLHYCFVFTFKYGHTAYGRTFRETDVHASQVLVDDVEG
jgi:type II secretory pathway component PulF